MKNYSSKEVLKILKDDGWITKSTEGSHINLIRPTKPGKVTVPHPKKSFKIKTLQSIFNQAGLKLR